MDSTPHSSSSKPSSHGHQHHQSSPTDLLSSAKVVAEAARSTFRHEGSGIDKARLAEAGEDLLSAATRYGKLDQKGFGSYIDKAEGYLHQYHSSQSHSAHSSTTTAAHSTSASSHSAHSQSEEKVEEEEEGGGYGDYLKMAQGFLKKH